MMKVVIDGVEHWRCAFCGMQYTSQAAARSCEDIHLDERTGTRNRD